MKSLESKLLLFLALFGLGSVAWSHPEEISYFCRGQEIRLEIDPSGAIVQGLNSTAKAAAEVQASIGSASKVLYSDPGRGRLAVRGPGEGGYEALLSKKASDIQVFPLYTLSGRDEPVIGFDEISVRLSPESPEGWLDEIVQKHQLEVVSQSVYEPAIHQLRPSQPGGFTCFELSERVRREPHFVWVTPVLYSHSLLAPPPNDPHFSDQIHHTIIETLGAWDVTRGTPSITIAMIDGGVDIDHEDLAPNVWSNPLETNGQPGIDDDGNGYVDDLNGWDFFDGDNDPSPFVGGGPDAGHGSAVAGLMVAQENNGLGVAGVAPGVQLIACKGFNNGGGASSSDLGEAIRYAANMADIINNSWNTLTPNNDILDAIDYAITQGRGGLGCLPIWASGNRSGDPTSYYARYPWTVGVSLTDYSDIHGDIPSYDSTVQLAAPLGQWSTDAGGDEGFNNPELDYVGIFDGTSSSAPIATAIGALILSKTPSLTAPELALALINSVDNPVPGVVDNDFYGKSPTLGYGRVNAHRAVKMGTVGINDRLEPNDSLFDAAELKSGYYTWLHLPEGDEDYYRLEGVSSTPMKFTLEWMNDWGPIGMRVIDSLGRTVATSTVNTSSHISTANIEFVPMEDDEYYLRVFSESGPGKAYSLEAAVGREDDAHEPNNSLPQAAPLSPGAATSYKGLVLNDDDYYRVSVNSGEYLYGLITFNQAKADVEIEVFNPSRQNLGLETGNTYGELIRPIQASEAGDYTIRVFGLDGDLAREYSLHLAVSNIGPLSTPGTDDAFEENDTFATATVLPEGFYPNLALDDQAGEVFDAYTFTVPAGKQGRLTMGWQSGGVDIDMLIYPEEVLTNPPGTTPPIGKSSRVGVSIESITLPLRPEATTYYTEIVRIGSGHQHYSLSLEYLDPEPCQIVGMWRFNEGIPGTLCDPIVIRDWRGPRMSHSPSLEAGAPMWVEGADPIYFPGSDGTALDLSGGGIRFDENGDLGELALGDRDFSFWARIRPSNLSEKRVIATMPGGWEFSILSDDTLELTVGGSNAVFGGSGPAVAPDAWQDVAFVWNRSSNQVLAFLTSGLTSGQASAAMPGTSPNVGEFLIGSAAGGSNPVGSVEQVRLFDDALSVDEILRFSVGFVPSSNQQWELYN